MFRFHDFNKGQLPDFWTTYYEHPELISIMAYANQILASKSTGYPLLQAYDLMNIGEHLPGTVIAWEELNLHAYRYTPGIAYPHSYKIPDNILSIQTIHDKMSNPTLDLQTGIDFSLDEDILGVLRLVKDIPTRPLLVESGILKGKPYTMDDGAYIDLTLVSFNYSDDYGFVYSTNEFWDRVDTLSLTLEDGSTTLYYANTDFVYDANIGLLKFRDKVPVIKTYIAKGTKVSTRLFDDYGNLLGYKRYDSTWYRDTLVALSSMFNIAPSIPYLKASSNIAFHLPVAKYGSETVMSLRNDRILTDKYEYKMYKSNTPYQLGDTLDHSQPLSDAIEMYTNRTHPNWWVDRLPQLFQKYALDLLTQSRKNAMMDTFLKSYLAHVRVDIDKVNTLQMVYQSDIWDLLMDALPIRSDIIVTTYKHIYDLDLTYPDQEKIDIRSRIFSIWSDRGPKVTSEYFIDAKKTVKHIVLPDHTQPDGFKDWYIGSPRYRIVGPNEQFKQFWSTERTQNPYVEPNFDHIFYREVQTSNIKMNQMVLKDVALELPVTVKVDDTMHTPGYGEEGSPYFSNLDEVNKSFSDVSIGYRAIPGVSIWDYTAFMKWTLNGSWLGNDGIICPLGKTGIATSNALNIGIVPKRVSVNVEGDIPDKCKVELFYSVNSETDFIPIADEGVVSSANGLFRVRVKLTSTFYSYPVVKEIILTISPAKT